MRRQFYFIAYNYRTCATLYRQSDQINKYAPLTGVKFYTTNNKQNGTSIEPKRNNVDDETHGN